MSDSITKITDQIKLESKKEIKDIESEADAEIKEIKSAAEKEIAKIQATIEESGKGSIQNEYRRIIGQSRLEAKMDLLNAKQDKLNEIFLAGKEKIASLTNSSEYPSILSKLIISAGTALGGGELTVLVRDEDKINMNLDPIILKINNETGTSSNVVSSSEGLNTKLGGVIVQKDDMWVDNTFEAIIDRRIDTIRKEVTKILFS